MTVAEWTRSDLDRHRAAGLVGSDDLDAVVVRGLTADPEEGRRLDWLRSAPFVAIAVHAAGDAPSAPVDVALEDEADLGPVLAAIRRTPRAARVLTDVLRVVPSLDMGAGLAVESLGYSTLLASAEFRRWLDERGTVDPGADDGRPPVRIERDGSVLVVTLDRPAVRNAVSARLRDDLVEALAVAEVDDSIGQVELRGAGPVFCSGGDTTEFGTAGDVAEAHGIRSLRSIAAAIARIEQPVTAHVHGPCVGAGVELAAFADRVVAATDTTFRLPEVGMGLIPGAGGTVSISRRIGRQRTAELALSGRTLAVDEALTMGLVDDLDP